MPDPQARLVRLLAAYTTIAAVIVVAGFVLAGAGSSESGQAGDGDVLVCHPTPVTC